MRRRRDDRRRLAWSGIDALEERALMSHGAVSIARADHIAPTVGETSTLRSLGHGTHGPIAPTVARWNWLANTYWYVPKPNVPSVLFIPTTQTLIPLSDQTVFHITGYRDGYFWGVTATQLGPSSPVDSSLVGTITPEGRVLLNFTQMDDSSSPTITQGIGRMTRKFGQWTMENQMFTSPGDTAQVGHWAYMVRTNPSQPSWRSLPAVGVSVPQFLEGAGPGPQPIVG
jgi:hypothetical protein